MNTESPTVIKERTVEITRDFAAPREQVFQAWIEPEQLARWFAPNGCTVRFTELDPRQGGSFRSCICGPDGQDCWCKGVYREVIAPERLVFTMALCDEHGNDVEASAVGKDPNWPKETTVTVTFAEFRGTTTLTLRQTVSEALAKRTGAYPSWLQMLDRLEDVLTAG